MIRTLSWFGAERQGEPTVAGIIMPEPIRHDDDPTPSERDLSRRSGSPAISIWLVIGVIALVAIGVYVASAVF